MTMGFSPSSIHTWLMGNRFLNVNRPVKNGLKFVGVSKGTNGRRRPSFQTHFCRKTQNKYTTTHLNVGDSMKTSREINNCYLIPASSDTQSRQEVTCYPKDTSVCIILFQSVIRF